MSQAERHQGQEDHLIRQADPKRHRELQNPREVFLPQPEAEREHDEGEDEWEQDFDDHGRSVDVGF